MDGLPENERRERLGKLRAEMLRYITLRGSITDSRVNRDLAEQIDKLQKEIHALGGAT